MEENNNYHATVKKVGVTTIIGNVVLSIGKILTGIFAKSSSLISDGIHSTSDILSTIVVLIGAKLGKKQADKEHPFGHERLESVTSIILALLLLVTATILTITGVNSIIEYANGNLVSEQGYLIYLAMGFAVLSILVKGWMYFYTVKEANKIRSTSLKADAIHHLTDSLSSFASLFGTIGLLIGKEWIIIDPIASIIIAIFIVKVSFDIARNGFNELVDKSAPIEFQNSIIEIVSSHEGVKAINSLKTRIFGNMYYVELEIAVDANLTVLMGHDIASALHDEIENKFIEVKHCMIHVDPYIEK